MVLDQPVNCSYFVLISVKRVRFSIPFITAWTMKSAANQVDGFLMKFLISYKLYSHREQPRISALEIVNLIVNIRIFLFSSFFFMKHPLNSREWHGTLFFWTVDAHSNPSVNFFSRKPRNNNYLGTNLCGLEIYL